LHTRCAQRTLEGDIEPIYWQGIVVGHVRKFDSKLQIEMLRVHMPEKFKTPGQSGPTIHGDNVFVITEEMRAKLMEANPERIMALPDSYLDASFTKLPVTPGRWQFQRWNFCNSIIPISVCVANISKP